MEELKEYLQKNKKIEIEKLLPNKTIKRYKTAFYFKNPNDFHFFIPIEENQLVAFEENEIVRILIYTKDGVFTFRTKILKCGLKIIKVQRPEKYKKIQRRGLLRAELPICIELEYSLNGELKRCETNIINISGSGISFNINDDLSNFDRILIAFKLEEKIIETHIKIIEIRKNLKENIGKYRVSAKFISLNNHEIEHIIKHCIRHQIKTLKKI